MFIQHVKHEQVFYKLKRDSPALFTNKLCWKSIFSAMDDIRVNRKITAEEKFNVSSRVFLFLIPVTNKWWATVQNNCKTKQIQAKYQHKVRSCLLPAVYAGEEDCLSFICRTHLSGVVNHPLFVTARAPSVNLDTTGQNASQFTAVDNPNISNISTGRFLLTTAPFTSESSSSPSAADDCFTGLKTTLEWISCPLNSGGEIST